MDMYYIQTEFIKKVDNIKLFVITPTVIIVKQNILNLQFIVA